VRRDHVVLRAYSHNSWLMVHSGVLGRVILRVAQGLRTSLSHNMVRCSLHLHGLRLPSRKNAHLSGSHHRVMGWVANDLLLLSGEGSGETGLTV
jgi:hypothetical protein